MDKRTLSAIVSAKTRISRVDVEMIIAETMASIKEAIGRGEKVTLRGFGTFQWKSYEEQDFVKPKSGEKYQLPPRRVPSFSPVRGFTKAVQAQDARRGSVPVLAPESSADEE